MALTEQRVLKQVTILPGQSAVNVQWADQILRDGVIISESFHRSAYTESQKDNFLNEVENAHLYFAALNW